MHQCGRYQSVCFIKNERVSLALATKVVVHFAFALNLRPSIEKKVT